MKPRIPETAARLPTAMPTSCATVRCCGLAAAAEVVVAAAEEEVVVVAAATGADVVLDDDDWLGFVQESTLKYCHVEL
jgi:hypothetical protein